MKRKRERARERESNSALNEPGWNLVERSEGNRDHNKRIGEEKQKNQWQAETE